MAKLSGFLVLKRLQVDPGLRRVAICAIAFWLVTLVLVLNRYYSFYTTFDQGIFNQVFWNSWRGDLFQSSLSSSLSTDVVQDGQVPEVFYRRLGQHFTPALLLWVPIYGLFQSAAFLSTLQVTLVAIAGLVLYALARRHLPPHLATLIVASYYGANAVIGPALSNFNDLCQIPLFVFSLLLALEKRQWLWVVVMTVVLLAVREDAGVVLFGIGCYLALSRRSPRVGLVLCSLSFVYMVWLTTAVMPQFSQDIPRRFLVERFDQFVEGEETSTLNVIGSFLSRPWLLIVELISPVPQTLQYLLGHWLPLAFIPVVSPAAWVMASFPLAQILLQEGDGAIVINMRYAITIIPGLFYGTILWCEQHQAWLKRSLVRRIWIGCIGLSLLFSLTSNPHQSLYFVAPESFRPWVYVTLPKQWDHAGQIRSLLARIPNDASVSATTELVPALSSRRQVLRYPGRHLRNDEEQVVEVDYIVADLWGPLQYQAAFDSKREFLQQTTPFIDLLVEEADYGLVGCQQGVVLFQQGVPSEPDAIAAWQTFHPQLDPVLQQRDSS